MSLKDDYNRNLQQIHSELQQERQRRQEEAYKKQMQFQEESRCRSLCEVVPSLRHWYADSDSWGHHSYQTIFRYTLAVPLAAELQSIILEFTEICPNSAWQTLSGKDTWQKCILADRSVHIFRVRVPGDELFRFGSQNYVILPCNFVKYDNDHWYVHDLCVFRDGYVHASDEFWTREGSPLSNAKELNRFLLDQLNYFTRYGMFDRNGRYIY